MLICLASSVLYSGRGRLNLCVSCFFAVELLGTRTPSLPFYLRTVDIDTTTARKRDIVSKTRESCLPPPRENKLTPPPGESIAQTCRGPQANPDAHSPQTQPSPV